MINSEFPQDVTRTELLSGISLMNLGGLAQIGLSVLVALACFTTAVGIVTGTADFMTERIKRPHIYVITVFIACFLGVVIGALSVNAIIEIALPVLLLIYPLTIVLILLNVMPPDFRTKLVMTVTVIATALFSLPDALKYVVSEELFSNIQLYIPLSEYGLGWVIPATLAFFGSYFYERKTNILKASS